MRDGVIETVRFAYVYTRDAADNWRTGDTEFTLGVAHGLDLAANVFQAIIEESDE